MSDRDGVGGYDVVGTGCAIMVFLWLAAAVALIVMHAVGVRPGDGLLDDLPRMPSDETGFSRLGGEAILITVVATAGLLPAGLAALAAVFVLDWLKVQDPAAGRGAVSVGVVVYVSFIAGIVLMGAWGWLVLAGLGPIAIFLAAALAVGWAQEHRQVRAKERARDLRVRLRKRASVVGARPDLPPPPPAAVPGADPQLGAEAVAWHARTGVDARLAWEISRWKCAAWAAAGPVLVVVVTWFAMAAGYGSWSTAADPEQRAFEDALLIVVVAAVFGMFSLVVAWEFGRLALFGGGLFATPDGLTLRFGRAVREFTWAEIRSAKVDQRRSGTVIVVRFREGGIRWPRAISFSSSDTDTMCITALVFADPADGIVKGIHAARVRFGCPGPVTSGS